MEDNEFSDYLNHIPNAIESDTELANTSASLVTAEGSAVVANLSMPVSLPKRYMEDGFTPILNSQLVNAREKLTLPLILRCGGTLGCP